LRVTGLGISLGHGQIDVLCEALDVDVFQMVYIEGAGSANTGKNTVFLVLVTAYTQGSKRCLALCLVGDYAR
jgi:hypothetical protein